MNTRSDAFTGWTALVERETERALIDRALARSVRGEGRFIVVYGQAGIGRSSLLRATTLDAEARGIAVLAAAGSELERGYRFGIVRQLLEGRIAALSPSQRRSIIGHAGPAAKAALGIDAPPLSGGCFDQIEGAYRLVSYLAAMAPLQVSVDDLQWCDRASLDFLCFLGHRATQLPVTIMTAWRRGEPGVRAGRLQALAGRPDTLFLTLAPLSHRGVRAVLTREREGKPDEEAVGVVHEQTGGQPFLVTELVNGLRLPGVSVKDGCGDTIAAFTPESVRRNVVARLGRHSEAVRRFAHAAAVLGNASLDRAAALAELDRAKAHVVADALARAGILRDDPAIAFAQPLVRRAVYETLTSLERADLHHRAAALLCDNMRSDPAALDGVTEHLVRSEPAGDPRFGAVLVESAVRAAKNGATAEAQRFLERALGEVDDAASRLEVLVRLAEFGLRTGDFDAAAAYGSEALTLASSPSERTAASLVCAETMAATTGWASAVELLDAEIQRLGEREADLRLHMQAAAATLRVCSHAPPWESSDASSRVESLAGETWAEQAMLAAWASHMVLTGGGSAERVIDVCARALEPRGTPGRGYTSDAAHYLAARAALLVDAWDLAEQALTQDSEQPFRATSDERELSRLALRAQCALARGDLLEADADARAALRLVEGSSPTAFHRRVRTDLLAVVSVTAIERARYGEAAEALTELSKLGGGLSPSVVSLRIALALAESNPAVALVSAAELEQQPVGIMAPGTSWRPWFALAYHAADEAASAVALAAEHLEHTRAWGSRSSLGHALTVRGVVDPGPDRLNFIEEAVAVLQQTSAKLELAHALVERGDALRRARRRREARDELARGADLAHRCGAEALSARARSELVAVGARPRRAAFSGVGSLTAGELRVARLAAGGMTNRAIAYRLCVSAKTVSGQLSAVYRKLDVHDRAALAAVMEKGGDGNGPLQGREREPVA